MKQFNARVLKLFGMTSAESTAMQQRISNMAVIDSALKSTSEIFYMQHRNALLAFLEAEAAKYKQAKSYKAFDSLHLTLFDPVDFNLTEESYGSELVLTSFSATFNRVYLVEGQMVRLKLRTDKL